MALVIRIFVVLLGFLAASFSAAATVGSCMMLLSGLPALLLLSAVYGTIMISCVALLPATIVVLVCEAFGVRSRLYYAVGGGIVGSFCYLGAGMLGSGSRTFAELSGVGLAFGAGIIAGLVYWGIAGRNAGMWRGLPPVSPRHGEGGLSRIVS